MIILVYLSTLKQQNLITPISRLLENSIQFKNNDPLWITKTLFPGMLANKPLIS